MAYRLFDAELAKSGVIVPLWGDGVIDVMLDTVHETLVTPPGIGYPDSHSS